MGPIVNLFLAFQIQAELAAPFQGLADLGFRAYLLAILVILRGGVGTVERHDYTIADGVKSALGLEPILSAGNPLSALELDGSLEDWIIVPMNVEGFVVPHGVSPLLITMKTIIH